MNTPWRAILLGTALVALAGCSTDAPAARPNAAAPNWIALEKTGGGLTVGPEYVVTLFSDGRVLFEGRAHVKSKGSFTRTVPREQARAIFAELEAINIWDRAPRYDTERANRGGDEVVVKLAPTDTAWDVITLRNNGRFKRIDGLFYAPHDLLDFKRHIEQTVGLSEWIGDPREWQP